MRDLRDPQKLGEALLSNGPAVRTTYGNDIPLSEIYDVHVCHFDIPNYPQDETMASITAREYRAELEAGAAAGDRYSKSALERLDGSS